MPLTRRIQVFISEEASTALDSLVEIVGSQTKAIEAALLLASARIELIEDAKLASQPASSLDTKPALYKMGPTAEELGLKPCLMHHIIGCQRCANCSHPAKARRSKKCLECGGIV